MGQGNIIQIPTEKMSVTKSTDRLIKEISQIIDEENMDATIAFITIITMGFAVLHSGTNLSQELAVASAAELAKTVYSGEGLEE